MLNYKRVGPFDERILRKMHTLEMTNYLIVQSEQFIWSSKPGTIKCFPQLLRGGIQETNQEHVQQLS